MTAQSKAPRNREFAARHVRFLDDVLSKEAIKPAEITRTLPNGSEKTGVNPHNLLLVAVTVFKT
jgi:hypothetical protein